MMAEFQRETQAAEPFPFVFPFVSAENVNRECELRVVNRLSMVGN